MISPSDAETLKALLKKKYNRHGTPLQTDVWYASGDNVLSAAYILEQECVLRSASEAIDFFEKPWKWEADMQGLVSELEKCAGEDDDGDDCEEIATIEIGYQRYCPKHATEYAAKQETK